MEEVWKFLRKESDEMRSCFRVSDKIELLFDMGCYCVVISIKDDCTCFNDKDNYDSIEDEDLSKINILSIQKINIYCGTCLYIEDGREYAETLHPFNYIANMLLKHINNKFRDSISCSNLGTYCFDDSCIMCDDVWEYGFVIDINSHWNDVDFFVFFHQIMNKLFQIETPTFYSNANNILDSLEVPILLSNTKTRRLGYLKLITKLFDNKKKMSLPLCNKYIEQYVQTFNKYLATHKNPKGIIVETKTGVSAKPYVELAESIGLIHKSSSNYELGKMGKVYLILKKDIDEDTKTNPFELTMFDMAFLGEQILKKDFFYLYTILEVLSQNKKSSYSLLKKVFHKKLLDKIRVFINIASNIDTQKTLNLKIIERRMTLWESSMSYLEHILMPRINWLYDLGIIEYEDKEYFHLTNRGSIVFFNISIWNDVKLNPVVNPTNYIDSYYMKIVNMVNYDMAKQYSVENLQMLDECITKCFDLFKTIAPNRVTFSLTANYCKYVLFWKYHITIDIDDIKNLLGNILSKRYIYKYQAQYNDGYIQIRY